MDPTDDGIVRVQDPSTTTRIGLPGLLALVFALSWLGAAPMVLASWLDADSPAALRSLAATLAPLQLLMFFGALLGVLVAVAVNEGRRGLVAWLRSVLRPRAGVRWILAVLAGPALVMVFAGFAGRWLDPALPPFTPGGAALLGVLQVFVAYLLLNTEEFAWRGYVLPRLQARLAPLQANLLLALVWGVFHGPYFLMKGGHPGGYGVLEFAVMVVAICLVMGVVFNATRGSVLACHLLHQSLNAWSEGLRLFPVMNGGSPWPFRVSVVLMACAGGVAAWWLWRQGRPRPA
ncbi:MAG: CPBP family intramembrane metalloprotease [Rhizobium sp.]|nr:CPBP family intramembrane metalloprotease [Rhizobium sp.]